MNAAITADDIRYHVTQMAADGEYDIDAIVRDIVAELGLIDLSKVEQFEADHDTADAVWQIVWRHDIASAG